jgi:hypothetical protein
MLLRWGLSFTIYGTAEIIGAYVDPSARRVNIQRAVTTAGLGAFADACILRAFHMAIDRRIPSPIIRTFCDQLMRSPMYNMGYLTIVRGTEWNILDTGLYLPTIDTCMCQAQLCFGVPIVLL